MTPATQSDHEVASPPIAVLQQERALPSISQLPTELLIDTLHLALPDVRFTPRDAAIISYEYFQILYAIRRVAKRWQEIIDGTPSFWTGIHSDLPPHVNNTIILRSAELPLTIVYDECDHLTAEEFVQAIGHTRPRWSVIVLWIDDATCMRVFLETPAPLLQTIVIQGGWNHDLDNEPLELLGGQTSNLRYVDIAGGPIRWKMGLFTQLKSLILTDVVHNGLTTSHILDFLGASPWLEYLHVAGAGIAPVDLPFPPTITLPYLKSIDLRSDCSVVTDLILRQIRAPSCRKFKVSVDNEGVDGLDAIPFINETLKPFERMLREFHVVDGASECTINSDGFFWHSPSMPDQEHRFSLVIGDFFDPLGIRWIGQILQKEPGLQFSFDDGDMLSQAVLEALAPMQCVTRAFIVGQEEEATRRIFNFLRTSLCPSSSLPSLPCLRVLQVSSIGWSAEDLLDMMRVRSSAFPEITMDRPNLTINIWRGPYTGDGSPRPIFDFLTFPKVRGLEGVESLRFVGPQHKDGTLAIAWDEEGSKPTRG